MGSFAEEIRRVTKWPPLSTDGLAPRISSEPAKNEFEYKPFVLDLQTGSPEPAPYERGSLYAPSRDPRLLRRRQ